MLNEISQSLTQHNYENALQLIEEYLKNENPYTDELAILEGSVYLETGQYEIAFRCILEGLKINPLNYELYFMLGNIYEASNKLEQAYLCYENAIFHCKDNEEDRIFLSSNFEEFKSSTNTFVPKVSIIIPVWNNLDFTKQCISSIEKYCFDSCYEIIVIDNNSTDNTKEYFQSYKNITYHSNHENLGFLGGCNIGMKLSKKEHDILLVHNDTIFTENALFTLRLGLYETQEIGAVNSTYNKDVLETSLDTVNKYLTYAFYNNIPKENALKQRVSLDGGALLLKRSAYEKTGDLEEQFFPGNYGILDYCNRLIQNDYKLVDCKNSFLLHYGQKTLSLLADMNSTTPFSYFTINQKRFIEKWKINPEYSYHYRGDLIDFMDQDNVSSPIHVLEIGCACGSTLLEVKNRFPNASIYGIDLDSDCLEICSHITSTVQGDIETLDNPFPIKYDYIIIGDVLEHLIHPDNLLIKLKDWLSPDGIILTSIPNILHYSAILPILMGNFAYADSGVLDRTHLRFFTKYNSIKLFQDCGYKILAINKNQTLDSSISPNIRNYIEQLTTLPNVAEREDFTVLQYLFKVQVDKI